MSTVSADHAELVSGPWTLPLDVISHVIDFVADPGPLNVDLPVENRKTLVSLASMHSSFYTCIIPHLYRRVGSSISQYKILFQPVPIRQQAENAVLLPKDPSLDDIHPARWPILTRLIWRFSFIQTIHFKPNPPEFGRTSLSQRAVAIKALQRGLEERHAGFKLFENLEHVVVDTSNAYNDRRARHEWHPVSDFFKCLKDTIQVPSICPITDEKRLSSFRHDVFQEIKWDAFTIHVGTSHPVVNAHRVIIDIVNNPRMRHDADPLEAQARYIAPFEYCHAYCRDVARFEMAEPHGLSEEELERRTADIDKYIRRSEAGWWKDNVTWGLVKTKDHDCQGCGLG